ncbi:MAG: hypothetical protein K2F72_03805, partial [Muribaculaceae bacterium]|nr:hypothetical protein [Muribaculaceae bacterium]
MDFDTIEFTPAERAEALSLSRRALRLMAPVLMPGDVSRMHSALRTHADALHRDRFGLHPVLRHLNT